MECPPLKGLLLNNAVVINVFAILSKMIFEEFSHLLDYKALLFTGHSILTWSVNDFVYKKLLLFSSFFQKTF